MACTAPAAPAGIDDLTLKIPPVSSSFSVDSLRIGVTAWGSVSGSSAGAFQISMTADLADLQDHLTPLLAAQLNRAERCGERLTVERAALAPATPAGVLTAWVHYERFGCVKAFGKEVVKRLVGGNAMVVVNLTPSVSADGVSLTAQVQKLEADGSLGELLRSGSLGESLRQKIEASIQNAIQKSANLKSTVPPEIAGAARLQTVRFDDGGAGRLWLSLAGEVRLSPEQFRALAKGVVR